MPRNFGPEARAERARILWVLVGVVLLGLTGRLVQLQLVRGEYFRALSEENRIRGEILRAERGRVLDRNGVVLADNYPSYRLTLDARDRAFDRNPAEQQRTVQILAEILERDPEGLAKDVQKARRLWSAPMLLSRNLSFAQVSRIEERLDRLPGVEVEPESMRRYPGGVLACHLLGHLGEITEEELARDPSYHLADLVGRAGLEKQYESDLRGVNGMAFTEVDAYGRRTHMFPELPGRPAVPGHDLILTLDASLQRVAERALEAIPPHGKPYPSLFPGVTPTLGDGSKPDSLWKGPSSALVALDPRTGEILAMASRPAFDPNIFVRGLSKVDWKAVNAPDHPLLNRAIQSAYPPGSVFKVITCLAGLEDGVVTPSRTFSGCSGGYFFGNRVFRCWRKGGHGVLAMSDALVHSCDVYFYQLGLALGVERLGRFAERARIATKTGVDLPQERAGLVPTPEWYAARYGGRGYGAGSALNISIGQGEVLLTPLQIARMIGAVAVEGRMMRPHLLRRIQLPSGEVLRDATAENWEDGSLPISRETASTVLAAMERVVMDNSGTGTRARVGGFRIAGKTGTAQNPHGDDHALFACVATVDDPRIVIAVVAEESGHGGSVSAPAAHRVLQTFLTGVVPDALMAGYQDGGAEVEGD